MNIIIIVSSPRKKLVMSSVLTYSTLFDKVTENDISAPASSLEDNAHILSAFCMVDSRCATAIVVLPLAASSSAV